VARSLKLCGASNIPLPLTFLVFGCPSVRTSPTSVGDAAYSADLFFFSSSGAFLWTNFFSHRQSPLALVDVI
jgi:hypothetical protein